MSEFVEWIAAEEGKPAETILLPNQGRAGGDRENARGSVAKEGALRHLVAHNFPSRPVVAGEGPEDCPPKDEWDLDPDPDIWLYRKKTTALLRRYMRWSLEAGRVPSVLGRELFRARITGRSATTFEERVIFLHDVEKCLDGLQDFDRQIIARVCLQEYDHEAAARILHCTRRTLLRRLPELIDELSEVFLKAELLERLPETTG